MCVSYRRKPKWGGTKNDQSVHEGALRQGDRCHAGCGGEGVGRSRNLIDARKASQVSIGGMVVRSARSRRAVKPRSRTAARQGRGALRRGRGPSYPSSAATQTLPNHRGAMALASAACSRTAADQLITAAPSSSGTASPSTERCRPSFSLHPSDNELLSCATGTST